MEFNILIVQELIQYLNEIFSELHYCFTFPYSQIRDPFSYYLSGHCDSFARVLMAIFPQNSIKYVSSSHVIVKIDDFYFDVRGVLIDVNLDEYRVSDENDLYIDSVLSKRDELEIRLEDMLIKCGKEKLKELLDGYSENLKNLSVFSFTKEIAFVIII